MQHVIIQEGQRALVYENGVLARFLAPGKHRVRRLFTDVRVARVPDGQKLTALLPGMERVLPAEDARLLEVAEHEIGLVSHGGKPLQVVGPGQWVLWQFDGRVDAEVVDLRPLHVAVPPRFRHLCAGHVRTQVVRPWERAVAFVDGQLAEVLTEGAYALSLFDRSLELVVLDMREQELQVTGQELITADKVTLRLSVLFKYRIEDPLAAVSGATSLHDALYAEVQLAARTAVAGVSVDQLLEQRVELAASMVADVTERVRTWGVHAARLDIKDVVLPGDMKVLLNQVIEAEKRAAAQNILRREETAATRSLANTAKLLEANPVLLRLKELELYKEVAERIPNLSVVVSPADVQRQLQLKVED